MKLGEAVRRAIANEANYQMPYRVVRSQLHKQDVLYIQPDIGEPQGEVMYRTSERPIDAEDP